MSYKQYEKQGDSLFNKAVREINSTSKKIEDAHKKFDKDLECVEKRQQNIREMIKNGAGYKK